MSYRAYLKLSKHKAISSVYGHKYSLNGLQMEVQGDIMHSSLNRNDEGVDQGSAPQMEWEVMFLTKHQTNIYWNFDQV